MSGLISIYLDIFRFLAALGVFYSHAQQHSGAHSILPPLFLDHKLVIFFFVISGYVIAASASRPDRTLANYSADRLARLSSVVIPALVLTAILDSIGGAMSPHIYAAIDPRWQPVRFIVNFFYCQQIWFLCVNPSCNTPMWSLGYEFWSYALFAVWIFVRSHWTKTVLLILISAFIGPKILLLLPAWAVGALAFHASKIWRCSRGSSLALFILSSLILVLAAIFDVQLGLTNGRAGMPPLFYSSNYFGDNLFAVIVAGNFLCCALFSRHVTADFERFRVVKFIRWLAGHTFSLYVYHMPILYFLRAVFQYDPYNLLNVLAAVFGALLIIVGLSKVTEERYAVLRKLARVWMADFFDRIRPVAIRWKLAPELPE